MPRQILPELEPLANQLRGIVSYYRALLDDEFMFGAAVQIPQAAAIFDRVAQRPITFAGEELRLNELLTLIAYRYGFMDVQEVGHGGYAIVIGHREGGVSAGDQRRVLRFVPDHHVRTITANGRPAYEFDVRLDASGEPIRDPAYPLLLSDLFLMPRHTTKLVFHDAAGQAIQAGGYPASLHCQLLPQVRAFNSPDLDRRLAEDAGNLLEAALATLGVSVADAHGGNGGALVGPDGTAIIRRNAGETSGGHYIPVVLDYGYYSQIGVKTLAELLARYGVTPPMVEGMLARHAPGIALPHDGPWPVRLAHVIGHSGLPRSTFGRLLYAVDPPILDPSIWIDPAEDHWRTTKEKTYPPLQSRSRLSRLYPDFDEVIFPQRIEAYHFVM